MRDGSLEGFDKRLGGRIRDARRRRNLTQAALAKQLGVTQQMVQKYESGASVVAPVHIAAICRVLRTSPDALFGYTSGSDQPSAHAIANVASFINNLPDELRRLTVAWLETFARMQRPPRRRRSKNEAGRP